MHTHLHNDLIVINGADVMADPKESAGYWEQIRAGGTTGIATPADVPQITQGLAARGYAESAIRGIMGENFLHLFERVWRAEDSPHSFPAAAP